MSYRWLAIGALFVAIAAALLFARSAGSLQPPLPKGAAERAALRDPRVRAFLARHRYTAIKALALDQTHWRITFFDRGHAVLDASVGPRGSVDAVQPHPPGVHATGSSIAWNRALLVGFALLFLAATTVVPLARMRNLDALVLAGGMLAVLLFYDARFVAGDTYSGALLLAYLIVRCLLASRANRPAPVSTPAYAALLQRVPRPGRGRLLGLVAATLIAVSGLLTYTATGISDVAFAGMAGATAIQRGDVPYGHVTNEVVHGDTYPPLTYVMYLPFSLASPVRNSFDDLQGALDLNLIALLLAAGLAYLVGSRPPSPRRDADTSARPAKPRRDAHAGAVLAIAWLSCPGILIAASGGGNDIPTACLVMGALAAAARPRVASTLLALATAAKLGPVGGLLVWVGSLRARPRAESAALALAVAAALLVMLVALGGADAIGKMINALAFQFRRGSFHCVWTQLGAGGAQAVFEAAVLTFALAAAWTVASSRQPPSLRQICALSAAVVLGLQLAANYWTFAYFAWALPLILVALFPPARRGSRRSAPVAP